MYYVSGITDGVCKTCPAFDWSYEIALGVEILLDPATSSVIYQVMFAQFHPYSDFDKLTLSGEPIWISDK